MHVHMFMHVRVHTHMQTMNTTLLLPPTVSLPKALPKCMTEIQKNAK